MPGVSSSKLQAPNPKHSQCPTPNAQGGFRLWALGFGIGWDLELGAWDLIYQAPESLADLHDLPARYGTDARLFVGGTDVIVRLRHGDMRPAALIDLKRVRDLSGEIAEHHGLIRIGARVSMTAILRDERIRRWFPALLEAA